MERGEPEKGIEGRVVGFFIYFYFFFKLIFYFFFLMRDVGVFNLSYLDIFLNCGERV